MGSDHNRGIRHKREGSRRRAVREERKRDPVNEALQASSKLSRVVRGSMEDAAAHDLFEELLPPNDVSGVLSPQKRIAAIELARGRRASDIALGLGVAHRTVLGWRKDRDFRRWVAAIQLHLNLFRPEERFKELLPEAIEKIATVMRTAGKETVQLQAALEVIERIMGKTTQTIEHKDVTLKELFDKVNKAIPVVVDGESVN